MKRKIKKLSIENIAVVGLVFYSLARAVPVMALGTYGVSAWIFLAIDLVTTIPYVYGTSMMVRGKTPKVIVLAALVALSSFFAPYAYIAIAGGPHITWLVWCVIGLYVSVALVLAVHKVLKDRKNKQTTGL